MTPDSVPRTAPLSVPDLERCIAVPSPAVPGGTVPSPALSDDDRNRYGVLLDHAAERGLLSPAQYQARLAELADARSEDELRRIVTELPAFGSAAGVTAPPGRPHRPAGAPAARVDAAALDSALWAELTPTRQRRGTGNPWAALAVVVVMLLVAIAVLALVGSHLAHAHQTGALHVVGAAVSPLRP